MNLDVQRTIADIVRASRTWLGHQLQRDGRTLLATPNLKQPVASASGTSH